jgi:hypothetical protein
MPCGNFFNAQPYGASSGLPQLTRLVVGWFRAIPPEDGGLLACLSLHGWSWGGSGRCYDPGWFSKSLIADCKPDGLLS